MTLLNRPALFRLGLAAVVSLAWQAPAVAQDPADAEERYFSFFGCYEVEVEEKGGGRYVELEERVYLTLVQLADLSHRGVPRFVVRPAPGYRASPFSNVYWLLVGGVGPLKITWSSPPFAWVEATFDVDGVSEPERLSGTAQYFSDVVSEEKSRPFAIWLTRVEC